MSSIHSKGGKAAAENLTPHERAERAKKASKAAYERKKALPKVSHRGTIRIGTMEIPCVVTRDGRRGISATSVASVFGGRTGSQMKIKKEMEQSGSQLPVFLASREIIPFVEKHLPGDLKTPFEVVNGTRIEELYDPSVLPLACNIWVDAKNAGVLHPKQYGRGEVALSIIQALASVGITALVDEATGYQEVRDKHALQKILDKYLTVEAAKWASKFPLEFYRQIFRLRNWDWENKNKGFPSCVGNYTNDLVYDRIAPSLSDALSEMNPKIDGNRKSKHHQHMTSTGVSELDSYLTATIALMKASDDWGSFTGLMDRVMPKKVIE